MARRRGQRNGYLRKESGSWLLTYRMYTRECPKGKRVTVKIGPSDGPGKLTEKIAERFAWDHYLKPLDNSVLKPLSTLTVSQFWNQKYLPHLETAKKYATQIQYKSLWSQWIEPALGNVRLFELTSDDVNRAIAAALGAGKSTATAKHIRKVASAIWTYAKQKQCASGDNPASAAEEITVEPVRMIRALTADQARLLLEHLPEPSYTMTLTALGMSMNVSELAGIEERHVNFTDAVQIIEASDAVPPHELAVRQHIYHARKGSLKAGKRKRTIPMPPEVEQALRSLIDRNRNRGPHAPIFQTRNGTPISADNLCKRQLIKTVERMNAADADLRFPHATWHVLRHTHATLTKAAGMSDYDRQFVMGHASMDMTDRYTHEDRERIRTGLAKVVGQIVPAAPKRGLVRVK